VADIVGGEEGFSDRSGQAALLADFFINPGPMLGQGDVGFALLHALPAHDALVFGDLLGLVRQALNGQVGTDAAAFLATGAKVLVYGDYSAHFTKPSFPECRC
jgi:hypothetical protein